jgi:glycosyltransferase involved in cell wall biosynthesis
VRIAIVSGICVANDAISAAVASQAESLLQIAGVERVDVFTQLCDRPLPTPVHTVHTSWELWCHDDFRDADVAIFHWGIHFDLFDALAIMRGRVPGATGPLPVVHFHNCTPAELVPPEARTGIERSLAQVQLVVGSDVPVWTFSEFNRATLLSWGVREDQIEFVPFAVEPPRPLRPARRRGSVDLACVGRMVPAKAQHVAIEALAALPADLRAKVTLTIAGSATFSSSDYVQRLYAAVADHDLGGAVTFLGAPDDERLWALYETTHVLLATSQHEGLCVPVLEAYHAGARVIGADAGNLPFIVQPPDPIVPALDAAALAEAIRTVAEDVLAERAVDRTGVDALLARYSSTAARLALTDALARLAVNA